MSSANRSHDVGTKQAGGISTNAGIVTRKATEMVATLYSETAPDLTEMSHLEVMIYRQMQKACGVSEGNTAAFALLNGILQGRPGTELNLAHARRALETATDEQLAAVFRMPRKEIENKLKLAGKPKEESAS